MIAKYATIYLLKTKAYRQVYLVFTSSRSPIILAVCVARQVTQSYLPRLLVPKDSAIDAKAKVVQAKVDAKLKKEKVRKEEQNDMHLQFEN